MLYQRSTGKVRHTGRRILIVTMLVTLAGLVAPGTAMAHGADDSDMSLILVRQAIAYIVNTPNDMGAIEDKMNDAGKAPDQSGVKIPLIEQAQAAFKTGDMHKVRALLESSIGARVHTNGADPVSIRAVPPPLTGTDTGTLATIDPMPGRGPLSGGDWFLLAISIAVGLGGLALSIRLRPHLPHIPAPRRGE